jgi:ABC-type transporter Mla subunit MlaD
MHPMQNITPGQGRMHACQAREASVKNRMTHLSQLATTMESKFDRHAQKVEDYYTNKVIPSGKTVANYNELVTAIQTQKTAVQNALATAQTDANSFSCTSGTAKEQVRQFREDMQAVKQALKAYRTSIKDLIVAVHSVGGEASPEPTE